MFDSFIVLVLETNFSPNPTHRVKKARVAGAGAHQLRLGAHVHGDVQQRAHHQAHAQAIQVSSKGQCHEIWLGNSFIKQT